MTCRLVSIDRDTCSAEQWSSFPANVLRFPASWVDTGPRSSSSSGDHPSDGCRPSPRIWREYTARDTCCDQTGEHLRQGALALALVGQSIPAFWLGLVLIAFVALRWGLLPTSGIGTWRHLILPAVALVPTAMGMVLRVTRISMIEVMNEDYVRTAVAKGMSPRTVVLKHGLKNAALPIITIMGLQVGALLGGAIITETVFAWPGVGQLAVNALIQRDWPVVRTVILLAAFLLVMINLLIDLIYAKVDTRVQFQ